MNKPNFFIVGAAKSGTTSLADYLDQHPDVYITPLKEPGYFLTNWAMEDFDEYLSLYKNAGDAHAIGDASTGYLYDEGAAERILREFPDARIIIILRNPVDMAFSLWRYMLAFFDERLSFEDAITTAERERRTTDAFKSSCAGRWDNYLYIERASYCAQVKRYLDTFQPENVKVYIFEEFFEDLPHYCSDVFAFLGVDTRFLPNFKRMNVGGVQRSKMIKKLTIRRYPTLRSILPGKLRYAIRKFVQDMNVSRGKGAKLAPETRLRLEQLFSDDIACLEKILGREISCWKKD